MGSNCDQAKNELKCDLDCKNGGVCQIQSGKQFCKCDSSLYKGDLCQIRIISACGTHENLCLNGGSCLANGECLCPPGYAGERCQTKRLTSQCGLVTCYNGGTCFIDNQNEYACSCHPAFTGAYCEAKITTTSTTTTKTTTTKAKSTTNEFNLFVFSPIQSRVKPSPVENRAESNTGFSVQEIALIVVAGVGIPVFSVLVVVLFCRIRSNRKLNKEIKTQVVKNADISGNKMPKSAVENIYVDCKKSVYAESSSSDKQVFVKTISSSDLSKNYNTDCKQIDNNIYTVIDFSNESLSHTTASSYLSSAANSFSLGNEFGLVKANFYSNNDGCFMASMV